MLFDFVIGFVVFEFHKSPPSLSELSSVIRILGITSAGILYPFFSSLKRPKSSWTVSFFPSYNNRENVRSLGHDGNFLWDDIQEN